MRKQKVNMDGRAERSRQVVLAETYRQMSQKGLASVSVDEISRTSGVSKTTIYRHWPSRSALLIDACAQLGSGLEVPDTGSLRTDLEALLYPLAEQLGTASWSRVMPSIVDAAERDASILAMQTEWIRSLMTPFDRVVDRAVARGDARAGTKSADIVAMMVGALFYRRWFSREPTDSAFVDKIAEVAVTLSATPARVGR